MSTIQVRHNVAIEDLPWELVYVLVKWTLGGPRKMMEDKLAEALGITTPSGELILEYLRALGNS